MAEEKKGKPRRPTAKKRDIQNEKKRLRNRIFKSRVKTAARIFETESSEGNLKSLYSLLDKGVKRGIYKLNKASRLKSKLSAKV